MTDRTTASYSGPPCTFLELGGCQGSCEGRACQASEPRKWPPAGYLCVVRGNDCPGHPSKWMVCQDGEA